jgi:hypothetical protein
MSYIQKGKNLIERAKALITRRSNSDVSVRGYVTIKLINALTGEVEQEEGSNFLVNNGLLAISSVMTGTVATQTNYNPETIRLGTDNTAATATDSALGSQQYSKTIETRAVENSTTTVLTVNLSTAQGNGTTYEEVGLFSNNDNMLARKVISPMSKDSNFSLVVEWKLIFAASN